MGAIKPSLHKFMFPSVRMIMHVGFYLHLHLYFEIDFSLGYFTRDRTDFMNLSQVWTLETQQFEMVIQDCPMSMSFRYKFCGERQFSCTVSSSASQLKLIKFSKSLTWGFALGLEPRPYAWKWKFLPHYSNIFLLFCYLSFSLVVKYSWFPTLHNSACCLSRKPHLKVTNFMTDKKR